MSQDILYPHQPLLTAMSFFFRFENTERSFSQRHNTAKKKTASNVLLRRTNISNKFNNVQVILLKKVLDIKLDPQRFREIDPPNRKPNQRFHGNLKFNATN